MGAASRPVNQGSSTRRPTIFKFASTFVAGAGAEFETDRFAFAGGEMHVRHTAQRPQGRPRRIRERYSCQFLPCTNCGDACVRVRDSIQSSIRTAAANARKSSRKRVLIANTIAQSIRS